MACIYEITKKSPFSGKSNTMEIVMEPEDYERWKTGGDSIQECLPYLTPDEREFLMTGITPEEWEKTFGT